MTVAHVFSVLSVLCNKYPLPDRPSCYTEKVSGFQNGNTWINRCCPYGYRFKNCKCIPAISGSWYNPMDTYERMNDFQTENLYNPGEFNFQNTLERRTPISNVYTEEMYRRTPSNAYNDRIIRHNSRYTRIENMPSDFMKTVRKPSITNRRLFKKRLNFGIRAYESIPSVDLRGAGTVSPSQDLDGQNSFSYNGKDVWTSTDIIHPSPNTKMSTTGEMSSYILDPREQTRFHSYINIHKTGQQEGTSLGSEISSYLSKKTGPKKVVSTTNAENEQYILQGRNFRSGNVDRSSNRSQSTGKDLGVPIDVTNGITLTAQRNDDKGSERSPGTKDILVDGTLIELRSSHNILSSSQKASISNENDQAQTYANSKVNDTGSATTSVKIFINKHGETNSNGQKESRVVNSIPETDPFSLEFKTSKQTVTTSENSENMMFKESKNGSEIVDIKSPELRTGKIELKVSQNTGSSVIKTEKNVIPKQENGTNEEPTKLETNLYSVLAMLFGIKSKKNALGSETTASTPSSSKEIGIQSLTSSNNVNIQNSVNSAKDNDMQSRSQKRKHNLIEDPVVKTSSLAFRKSEKVITIAKNTETAKGTLKGDSENLIKKRLTSTENEKSPSVSQKSSMADSLNKAILDSQTENIKTSKNKTETFTVIKLPVQDNENSIVKGIEFKIPYRLGKLLQEHALKIP